MAKKTRKVLDAEAQICLNCPYPKCIQDKGKELIKCDYYNAEIKKAGERQSEINRRNIKPSTQAV